MALLMSTGKYGKLLLPTLNEVYMVDKDHALEYTQIWKERMSDKPYEQIQSINGLNLVSRKPEGAGISYNTSEQGFTKTSTHSVIAGGFVISREMIEFNKYQDLAIMYSKRLRRNVDVVEEHTTAEFFDSGFTTTDPVLCTGDGLSLFNSAHLLGRGGTQSNTAAVSLDVSEASIEAMITQINTLVDDVGEPSLVRPDRLYCHIDNEFEVTRILGGDERYGTADRDINAIRKMGKLPKDPLYSHYLQDVDAHYILTDFEPGLVMFKVWDDGITQDQEFDTENIKFKISRMRSFCVPDHRAAVGNPGS